MLPDSRPVLHRGGAAAGGKSGRREGGPITATLLR